VISEVGRRTIRGKLLRALNELVLALLELEVGESSELGVRRSINAAIQFCADTKSHLGNL